MGYVGTKYNFKNGTRRFTLKPYLTDLKCFNVVKARSNHICYKCGKKIPSKSYLYSSDWIKLCLNCGEEFSHEAIKGYEKIIEYIKNNQQILIKNKEKWEAENLLSQL